MAKNISGLVASNGSPAEGSQYQSAVLNQNPYAVAITYDDPFDRVPIAAVEVSGSTAGVTTAVQSSNTSLAIYTDSSEPVPLFFWASTRGLDKRGSR